MAQRLTKMLRRRHAEQQRVDVFLAAIAQSAYTWDQPTQYRGLAERTDTVQFPRIVLQGTVAG
jgi:hypothetical protein